MAIALDTSTAWADDGDFNQVVTTASFSPAAGTILLAFVSNYDNTSVTITNSGTSLTWTQAVSRGASSANGVRAFWAYNASAQSNITVTATCTGFAYPSIKVYSLTGADTSDPIGVTATGQTTGADAACPVGSSTLSEVGNSWQFTVANANATGVAMTSPDLTYSATSSLNYAIAGYRSIGASAGTALASTVDPTGSATVEWATFELRAPSATTHNADAALSTTSTVSPTIAATRAGAAALSTASAITSTAALTRPLAAALSTTSAITAAAALTAAAAAAVSTTATLTATMDVTPAAGTVTFDAALSTTSALTATAVLERPAAAALSTAVAIAATMVIEGSTPTTVGFMRAAELAAATIRPRGGVTLPTIAALVSIDEATMTAVVSTSVTPSRYGVPVLVGGSVDPVTAGLVPSGSAYVWFADDGIHVQGAS